MGPSLAPGANRGTQKGLSGPKQALLGALAVPYRSLEEPKHMNQDMDASQPGTLCLGVLGASRTVWAVPGPLRRPKGAQKPII